MSFIQESGFICDQQSNGAAAGKPSNALVTRRTAAKYKQKRAAKGSKGSTTLVSKPPAGTDMRSSAQRKADHFAKKAAGLAKVKKGYISRPTSGAQARKRLALPAAAAPAKKKGGRPKGSKNKAKAANPFDASGV